MPKELSDDYRAGWRDSLMILMSSLELLVMSNKARDRKTTLQDVIRVVKEQHNAAPRFTR